MPLTSDTFAIDGLVPNFFREIIHMNVLQNLGTTRFLTKGLTAVAQETIAGNFGQGVGPTSTGRRLSFAVGSQFETIVTFFHLNNTVLCIIDMIRRRGVKGSLRAVDNGVGTFLRIFHLRRFFFWLTQRYRLLRR